MSFDFALDNRGDFIIGRQDKVPKFKIEWHDSDYPVFRLRFYQAQPLPSIDMVSQRCSTGVNNVSQITFATLIEGKLYNFIINQNRDRILSIKREENDNRNYAISGLSFVINEVSYTLTLTENTATIHSNKFNIRFYSMPRGNVTKYKLNSVSDYEELKQRIRTLLRVERGEFRYKEDWGSYLQLQKHEDINSDAVRSMIVSMVMSDLATIGDNFSVMVAPKTIDGPFYCQNLSIYIYLDNKLLFDIPL